MDACTCKEDKIRPCEQGLIFRCYFLAAFLFLRALVFRAVPLLAVALFIFLAFGAAFTFCFYGESLQL